LSQILRPDGLTATPSIAFAKPRFIVQIDRMETLNVDHNLFLVAMACIVALAAGFTGLSMTRELATKPVFQKKALITLAAIALGGGIWAMHFIAMLGLQLPVLFYYDAAITLVSALSAILIVGAALILLHFADRTPMTITMAGGIVGVGVLVMHYIGMAGLERCRAVYSPLGVGLSSIVAIALCILAFWIAYGKRSNRNIMLGTLCFAISVCSVHFLAIAGTNFVAEPGGAEFGPSMSNETLALGVIFFSFVIFGACLWVSVTYLVAPADPQPETATARPIPNPRLQIPCERDGSKVFIAPSDVSFVRADGHYTQVYTNHERLFCVWPVTEATKRLLPAGFLQTHRSYLVNPKHVSRFERTKDKGRCLFNSAELPPAPVSRSKLKAIQEALAAQSGATRAS
jgi:NO-binding membrane sensor protein with MHYT domain